MYNAGGVGGVGVGLGGAGGVLVATGVHVFALALLSVALLLGGAVLLRHVRMRTHHGGPPASR